MPTEGTLVIVVTVSGFCIQCVARSTALQPDARVGPYRIITPLTLQAFMCIYLTLVDIHTCVRDLIKHEANFAVTPKTANFVGANLIAIAGVLIGGTFVNIYALVVMTAESRCTGLDLLLRRKWIVFHHGDTIVRAFNVDTLEALVTGGIILTLVDIFTLSCFAVIPVACFALDVLYVQATIAAFQVHTNLIISVTCCFSRFALVHIDALTCPLIFLITPSTV